MENMICWSTDKSVPLLKEAIAHRISLEYLQTKTDLVTSTGAFSPQMKLSDFMTCLSNLPTTLENLFPHMRS